MEKGSGFRIGALVGGLVVLVVALAVGVVVLATGGDETTTVVTATTTSVGGESTDGVGATTNAETTDPTPTTPDATSCPDVPDIGPTGADPADAVNVSIVAVDCELATRIIKGYLPAVIGGGGDPTKGVAVEGFTCTESDESGITNVECVENVGQISFDLG